jgi:exopolysaccharide biosynthesis polyprenyl glycosylphosphotransferase
MLAADRRTILVLKADTEPVETLTIPRTARARMRVASSSSVTPEVVHRLGRRPGTVVVTSDALGDPQTAALLAGLSLAGVRVVRPHDYHERVLRRVSLEDIDESWFLFHRPLRARRAYAAVKRVTDWVAGLLGSLLVCLVVPLVALVVRLEDGGPVFFRQARVGRGGRPFEVWKFRTMRLDAEADGPVWAAQDDCRVTRVGRVLRRTRLDELPQFFNVLKGDMSLVGPRPERPRFTSLLERAVPFYDRRHLMRPGITGWASVRFGYGASVGDKWRSHEYDLYYLKHRSLSLDLEILVRTVVVMLLRRGQ